MSNIEWTDATWNPTAGCYPVSPGCLNCYAKTMTKRLAAMGQSDYAGLVNDKHFSGTMRTMLHKLDIPLKRRKPTMYFVNSMSDLFHEDLPFAFIDRVFAVMALCPQHTFQVLTKRPERMAEYTTGLGKSFARLKAACPVGWAMEFNGLPLVRWPLPNVWLGTSVEDQTRADERRKHIKAVAAAVRFVSYEPALGAVAWDGWEFIDWLIVGGESGHGARGFNVQWAREAIHWCERSSVACFVKQLGAVPWDCNAISNGFACAARASMNGVHGFKPHLNDKKGGDMTEWPADLRVRQFPASHPSPASPGVGKG